MKAVRRHRNLVAAGMTTLAAVVGVAVASGPVHATPSTATSIMLAQSPIRPTDLFAANETITGKPWAALIKTYGRTDGYVVENDFQPGQTTGFHSHPGPSLVFVVSGSVTNYASDQPNCKGITYSAGKTFVDPGGTDVHEVVDTGSTPAQTIAVQFIPHGKQRRVDQPEPANCHV